MRKIWLVLAAFLLATPLLAGPLPSAYAAGTGSPVQTPDDRVMGKEDAPVTIFEYASLTCPHCAEFDAYTLPQVEKAWVDTGKAKIIYRDYPLDQAALRAAMLARCAPPDRFFAFVDALFRSQATWGTAPDVGAALANIAKLGGIGQAKFDQCTTDQKLADAVVKERLVAQDQYGIDSTPTFFINGKKMVGALPYADFDKELTAAYEAAGGKPAASQGQSAAPAPEQSAGKP